MIWQIGLPSYQLQISRKKSNKSFAFSDQYCMDEGAINNICRKSSGKNFHSVIL